MSLIPEKAVDIKVNLETSGKRKVERAEKALEKLNKSLVGTTGAAEGADHSVEDLNRSLMQTGAQSSQASGGLATLESQLIATQALTEAFGDDLDEVTDNADIAQSVFEDMSANLEGSFEDAGVGELNEALEESIESFIRGNDDINSIDLAKRLGLSSNDFSNLETAREMGMFRGYQDLARDSEKYAENIEDVWDLSQDLDGLFNAGDGDKNRGDFLDFLDDVRLRVNDIADDSEALENLDLQDVLKAVKGVSIQRRNDEGLSPDLDKVDNELDTLVGEDGLFEGAESAGFEGRTLGFFDNVLSDEELSGFDGTLRNFLMGPSDGIDDSVSGLSDAVDPSISKDLQTVLERDLGKPRGDPEDLIDLEVFDPDTLAKAIVDGDTIEASDFIAGQDGDIEKNLADYIRKRSAGESILGGDNEPRRSKVVDSLQDYLGSASQTEASIFHNIMEDLDGGFARSGKGDRDGGVPFKAETVRAKLWEQFVNSDSRAVQENILNIFDKLEKGDISLPSIAGDEAFKGTFETELSSMLEGSNIPDEVVPHVVPQIADEMENKMQDEEVFLDQLLERPERLNKLLDDAIENFQDMEIEGENNADIFDSLVEHQEELVEATDLSAQRVEELFETRAAPREIMALEDDQTAFGVRSPGTSLLDPGKDGSTDKGLAFWQRKQARDRFKNVPGFGIGDGEMFEGFYSKFFKSTDKAIDKVNNLTDGFDLLDTNALDADQKLRGLQSGLQKAIPTLGATSANIGMLNVSMAKTGMVIYGVIALLGPLITALLGLVTALLAATAAFASFTAVGAVGFLQAMEEQMAGVNDKADAMKELFEALKEDLWEAMAPLRDANIGGEGADFLDMFVNVLKGSLQFLHQFAHVMAEVVEMDEFQSFVENVSDALFGGTGGPSMVEAMKEMAKDVFPLIEDMLVYFIDKFPEFIMFISEVTKRVVNGFGPAFAKLIPILAAGIEYGSIIINVMGTWINIFLTLGEVLWGILDVLVMVMTLGFFRMSDVMTLLITVTASVVGVTWAATTAYQVLGFVLKSQVVSGLWWSIKAMYGFTSAMLAGSGAASTFWSALLGPVGAVLVVLGLLWKFVDWGEVFDAMVTKTVSGIKKLTKWWLKYGNVVGLTATLLGGMSGENGLISNVVDWFMNLGDVVDGVADSLEWVWDKMTDILEALKQDVENAASKARPGERADSTGTRGKQVVNNYDVTVNGGDEKSARETRRELDKRERRRQRYNGSRSYTGN